MADPAKPIAHRDASAGGAMLSVEEARDAILDHARPVREREAIPVQEALGRVVAGDHVAPVDVPGFANSSMDGFAVHSSELADEGPHLLPVTQRISAGSPGSALAAGEAARIFTGAALPEGADAVVIQEDCELRGDSVVVPGPVGAGDNVRPRGNDITRGTVALEAGTRVRPQEMGLAASVGLATLEVVRRLRVAILSSGDELLQPGEPLRPGTIYNSNRFTLMGLLHGLGCEVVDLGTVADTLEATRRALVEAASRADVVVTSGGMSVGEEDHLRQAVAEAGRLELWRVAVKPGKPLAFGRVAQADFLGLPGNPVSTLVTFCLFVRPFLLRRQGVAQVLPRAWSARAAFSWPRPGTRREYVRARLDTDSSGSSAVHIFPRQGSDVLSSSVWADGLAEIPEGARIAPGDSVRYYPFSDLLA